MSKWTTVRVDKETAERLKGLAGGGSVSSLLERMSLGRDVDPVARDPVRAEPPAVPVAVPVFKWKEETVTRTQPVAKESPFEARAHKRTAAPTIKTNEFGDAVYDD